MHQAVCYEWTVRYNPLAHHQKAHSHLEIPSSAPCRVNQCVDYFDVIFPHCPLPLWLQIAVHSGYEGSVNVM